jgi:predicted phage-related endonuclease
MLANIDREVIGTDDVQILECKTAGINGARLWKEGVPVYVQLQVMHQLAVTGKRRLTWLCCSAASHWRSIASSVTTS